MKPKSFDCVKMKQDIQEAILREMGGTTPEQFRKRSEELIASDPVLGHLWRNRKSRDEGQ